MTTHRVSHDYTKEHNYSEKDASSDEGHHGHAIGHESSPGTALHRGLKARHITMIAIGGAIGTGLIIGTGAALARAGPGSVFIAYSVIGYVVFLVMSALGEMAAWLPMSSGFTGYATRFCDPSLGFALGWVRISRKWLNGTDKYRLIGSNISSSLPIN